MCVKQICFHLQKVIWLFLYCIYSFTLFKCFLCILVCYVVSNMCYMKVCNMDVCCMNVLQTVDAKKLEKAEAKLKAKHVRRNDKDVQKTTTPLYVPPKLSPRSVCFT